MMMMDAMDMDSPYIYYVHSRIFRLVKKVKLLTLRKKKQLFMECNKIQEESFVTKELFLITNARIL